MTDLKLIKESFDLFLQMEIKLVIEKLIIVLSEKYNHDKDEIYDYLKQFDIYPNRRVYFQILNMVL